jgi:sulfur carrier protein ThiS
MKVHIRLFSRFREKLPPEARGETTIEVSDGASVQHLLEHLDIHRPVKLIVVNGERETDLGRILCDGDAVRIYPVVVGG